MPIFGHARNRTANYGRSLPFPLTSHQILHWPPSYLLAVYCCTPQLCQPSVMHMAQSHPAQYYTSKLLVAYRTPSGSPHLLALVSVKPRGFPVAYRIGDRALSLYTKSLRIISQILASICIVSPPPIIHNSFLLAWNSNSLCCTSCLRTRELGLTAWNPWWCNGSEWNLDG